MSNRDQEKGKSMNKNTIMVIFGIILLGLGIFIILKAFQMKKSGHISDLFVSPDEMKKCRDEKSFVNELFMPCIIFGLVSAGFGIEEFLNLVFKFPYVESVVAVAVFLAVWIYFSHMLRVKKDKYIKPF
jgi:uncharacterized membrane protein HdeD (DUF308 family)